MYQNLRSRNGSGSLLVMGTFFKRGQTCHDRENREIAVERDLASGQTWVDTHPASQGDPPERFVLGAFEGEDTLIGMVGFFRETLSKMRHKATIWGMYVTPERRGQGIGKLLLEDLLKRSATLAGLEQVHLTVVTTNESARHLYATVGFQVYGLEPHPFKQGEWYLDEELMLFSLLK